MSLNIWAIVLTTEVGVGIRLRKRAMEKKEMTLGSGY